MKANCLFDPDKYKVIPTDFEILKAAARPKRTKILNRKYYLHKKIKGFVPKLLVKKKLVICFQTDSYSPKERKYLNELITTFGYSLQTEIINGKRI